MNTLYISLSKLYFIETVTPLFNASVPIIKFTINSVKILMKSNPELYVKLLEYSQSNFFDEQFFCKKNVIYFKFDLNFNTQNNSSKKAVLWANHQMTLFPQIKPIMIFLKKLVSIKGLNVPYNGGISSYSLLILVIFFIQVYNKEKYNLGEMIVDYFELYGTQFDFYQNGVNLNMRNSLVRLQSRLDSLYLIDPVNPFHNVGKSTFKIFEIQKFFNNTYLQFKRMKEKFDLMENRDLKEINIFEIYDNL